MKFNAAIIYVRAARLQQRIGWPGMLGLLLFAAAVFVFAVAWPSRQVLVAGSGVTTGWRPTLGTAPVQSEKQVAALTSELPPASDIPLLLTQIEQAAIRSGLKWRAAEYRTIAATPTQPASLEVRCALRASYPKLRGLLMLLKESIPSFAIREFSMNRPNAETADVDAKLVLAVLLQDETSGSVATAPSTQ